MFDKYQGVKATERPTFRRRPIKSRKRKSEKRRPIGRLIRPRDRIPTLFCYKSGLSTRRYQSVSNVEEREVEKYFIYK